MRAASEHTSNNRLPTRGKRFLRKKIIYKQIWTLPQLQPIPEDFVYSFCFTHPSKRQNSEIFSCYIHLGIHPVTPAFASYTTHFNTWIIPQMRESNQPVRKTNKAGVRCRSCLHTPTSYFKLTFLFPDWRVAILKSQPLLHDSPSSRLCSIPIV